MSNAKSITIADVLSFIHSADRETRRLVNREILAMADQEEWMARDEFSVGDKVKFTVRKQPYFGKVITGVVIKRNVKTIEVRPDAGGRNWKVSPSLLSKA